MSIQIQKECPFCHINLIGTKENGSIVFKNENGSEAKIRRLFCTCIGHEDCVNPWIGYDSATDQANNRDRFCPSCEQAAAGASAAGAIVSNKQHLKECSTCAREFVGRPNDEGKLIYQEKETNELVKIVFLNCCLHFTCKPCLKTWIVSCEASHNPVKCPGGCGTLLDLAFIQHTKTT